jgi:hypothetical protein
MTSHLRVALVLDFVIADEAALQEHAYKDLRAFEEDVAARTGIASIHDASDAAVLLPSSALVSAIVPALESIPGVGSVGMVTGSVGHQPG